MKRKDFLKGLGIGSLFLIPGVKSAISEPEAKEVIKKVPVEKYFLVPQGRYQYRSWTLRYISSMPDDFGQWRHKFVICGKRYVSGEESLALNELDDQILRNGIMIELYDIHLTELIFLERMYPPKA